MYLGANAAGKITYLFVGPPRKYSCLELVFELNLLCLLPGLLFVLNCRACVCIVYVCGIMVKFPNSRCWVDVITHCGRLSGLV